MPRNLRLKITALPIPGSVAVWQGNMACIDTSAGLAKPGASGNANLIRVGLWEESVDNSGSTATSFALVSLDREVVCQWFDNDTGSNAVTASNLFSEVYILDNHTVTTSSSGNSKAGRVWAVDSVKGVAVAATSNT
jgi:hypothetical protein